MDDLRAFLRQNVQEKVNMQDTLLAIARIFQRHPPKL